jgi:cytochrome c-type biogenesis protein
VAEPTLVLAAFAGLASFFLPCILPVIPAFLAQLVGTSLDHANLRRRDVLVGTFLFVIGFSTVFAALGVVLGAVLQSAATGVLAWLSRLSGAVIILLGLHVTGLLRLPVLDRRYAAQTGVLKPGNLASFLFGASFAVAWTPCVGPILGSTLALATTQPTSAFPQLLAYAAGLGAPFLLVVGVHSPEFGFEKDISNVCEAVEQADIEYPVVLDNHYAIWNAYGQRFWPAWYLIDADGFVRYRHFGEGAYGETDQKIAELLAERDRLSG